MTYTETTGVPLVSIVIPCFNSGEFLAEAVQSALAQTYSNFEVVVVDDGSTDAATLVALEAVSHSPRVSLVRTENMGLAAARNNGIRASQGSYFLPLDSDDKISRTYVSEAVAVAEANPEIGIVYPLVDLIGDLSGRWKIPDFSWKHILVHNLIVCTSLFRRADWEAAGGYDESMRRGREDHDFILRVLSLGRRPHRIDKVHFYYRRHGVTMNDAIANDRVYLLDNSAKLLQNNTELYSEHARDLFEFIFDQHDQIMDLKHRYARLERLRQRYPKVLKTAQGFRARASRAVKRLRARRSA